MIKYTLAVGFAIFIVLFLFYSPFTRYSFLGSPPEQRSSCGKFDGEVFDFPAPYVFLSPEYEGLSIWEQGYKKNKRGCDANFTVVALKVQWPSLLPAEKCGLVQIGRQVKWESPWSNSCPFLKITRV